MRARRRHHRILGIILALPLLWLCATGLLLNHGPELNLDQRHLQSRFFTSFYLEEPSAPGRRCEVGSRRISQWGEHLFLDAALLPFSGTLVGASALGPNLLIATTDHLYLLGPQGDIIDSLGEASLPGIPLQALQTSPLRIIKTAEGAFLFDDELLNFSPSDATDFPLNQLPVLTEESRRELWLTLASETPISYSRLLLDLHKFAFLGGFGKWVLTISTLGLVALTFTGLMLSRKKRTNSSL